jgi:hypothetical protein
LPGLENVILKMLRLLRKLPVNILGIGAPNLIFTDLFKDFEKLDSVKGIFGEKTEEVLHHLKVELIWYGGYMYVDGSDGHLVINRHYLNYGDKIDIYLDLIHELYHVKQFLDGRELFDPNYDYVERPTEIEAYSYAVREARRLGLSDERICQYLKTEWMSDNDVRRLARAVNVHIPRAL